MTKKLILASSSPRRQELLEQVKIPFIVRKQHVEEALITTKDPREKVIKLAKLKGKNSSILHKDEVILTADTVVSFEQHIFEKPHSVDDARRMIHTLSGNIHDVYTSVMLRSLEKDVVFAERTKVEFWPLSKQMIDSYINTEEPFDKAGAYGIQSVGAIFVKRLIGDYYNVVGLPVSRVVRELEKFSIYPQM